jgi:dolichol-phosphate mannosyltransferase
MMTRMKTPARGALSFGERGLVIVPTYNESENVTRIVPRILEQDPRLDVLIVDDNSPDGTGRLADELAAADSRVHVLHREEKAGLGRAYLAGFRWALERDYAFVFEMDADFSHDPAHLPEFLASIRDADLVLGSRYRDGKVTVVNWPMTRLLLSYGANIYARAVTGLHLGDATGGFKCFRREVLAAIPLDQVRSNGYAFQIEMSFRAWKRGFRIAEIPIVFHDRTEGESKMSKGIVREAIWMVWRLRWWGITGRY